MNLKIAHKEIGRNQPTFIIAEAGINHNGNLDDAKRLVDVAVNAGADAVKFQTFLPTELPFKNITYDETTQLKAYCDKRRIIFLSTPHSLSAVDFLADIVPAFKIASTFITNDYFVKRVRLKGKVVIASTRSMTQNNRQATKEEVKHFMDLMNTNRIILLYCISEYPCYNFDDEAFLEFIDFYQSIPVGFSCHSKNIEYSVHAVELGARVIEQHITLDDSFECPDKKVSLNPMQLKALVEAIREVDNAGY
jgi:N-acetylneuraminate synthase/N,N'-diacetyllegionaminate synthase